MIPGRPFLLLLLAVGAPATAQQRQPLGVFGTWGAFSGQGRCFAISEPLEAPAQRRRPFASVAHWPGRAPGAQLHIRLSQEKRQGSAVILRIDGRSFQLMGGGDNAWAPDARADVEIQTAMRTGIDMVVETRSAEGRAVRDRYRLRGAATAMDAAALACAPRR